MAKDNNTTQDTSSEYDGDMHDCGYDREDLPVSLGGKPETKRIYPTLRIDSEDDIPTQPGEHSYVIVARRIETAERDANKAEETGKAPYSCELEVKAIKPLGGVEDEEDEDAEDKGDSTSKLEDAASAAAAGKQMRMSASQIRKMMSHGGMEASVEE